MLGETSKTRGGSMNRICLMRGVFVKCGVGTSYTSYGRAPSGGRQSTPSARLHISGRGAGGAPALRLTHDASKILGARASRPLLKPANHAQCGAGGRQRAQAARLQVERTPSGARDGRPSREAKSPPQRYVPDEFSCRMSSVLEELLTSFSFDKCDFEWRLRVHSARQCR